MARSPSPISNGPATTSHHVIVPWTMIALASDAERVAGQLSANPPNSARRTSISGALEFGADLFAESRFQGIKRVIDISGDGPNNQGPPVDSCATNWSRRASQSTACR